MELKPYKLQHILADKTYDAEPIRKCINEEVGAFDQNTIRMVLK